MPDLDGLENKHGSSDAGERWEAYAAHVFSRETQCVAACKTAMNFNTLS